MGMDIRYSANQRDVKRYTQQELRDEFLIQNLFVADEVVAEEAAVLTVRIIRQEVKNFALIEKQNMHPERSRFRRCMFF